MSRTALGRLTWLIVPVLLTVMAACGSPPEGGVPAEEQTAGEEEVDAAAENALPESELFVPLEQIFGVGPDGDPRNVDETGLPAPAGSVSAHWYRSGARYVILFQGLDMTTAGGLCPGSSIEIGGEFKAVNNSPTEEGACPEGYTIDEDAARVCGSLLMYVTQIHEDETGNIYASIDKLAEDGGANGMSGSIGSDKEAAPEIDIEQTSFALPESLGGGEANC